MAFCSKRCIPAEGRSPGTYSGPGPCMRGVLAAWSMVPQRASVPGPAGENNHLIEPNQVNSLFMRYNPPHA